MSREDLESPLLQITEYLICEKHNEKYFEFLTRCSFNSVVICFQQIDGAGLVLLNVEGFTKLLNVPLGAAITLDGITRLARQFHSLPLPV